MLYIAIFILGTAIGFFIACLFSASKITELENENNKLKKELRNGRN